MSHAAKRPRNCGLLRSSSDGSQQPDSEWLQRVLTMRRLFRHVPKAPDSEENERIAQQTAVVRDHFDASFYLHQNPDIQAAGIDPLDHYMRTGWKEGRNPRDDFDTYAYARRHLDVALSGLNPFFHYLNIGKAEGRSLDLAADARKEALRQSDVVREHFDTNFYLTQYPDVKAAGIDPLEHFMTDGWREGRNPRADFDTFAYARRYLEVAFQGINPFYHYISAGKAEGRVARLDPSLSPIDAAQVVQNHTFPLDMEAAENLFIILVPEHNEMSGGIFSFFSIARAAYILRHKHDYSVMLMTRPNPHNLTYLRQRNFRNSEDVFRFEQIVRCRKARKVYIQIPEYAAPSFIDNLQEETLRYLHSRQQVHINILNQKTDIMPSAKKLASLRGHFPSLSQSVAHHAYFGQTFCDQYHMPMLLLPAYTDLSAYSPLPFEAKESLIIYSPDDSLHRRPVLEALARGLPDYELREIRNITFDEYMDLATRCRFSITFGEGFDGYMAQPIHQGGIGFAVYNEEFFPSRDLIDFANIFPSGEAMAASIVDRVRLLEKDKMLYERANRAMIEVYDKLYSREDYLARVEMLINRKFELFPGFDLADIHTVNL